MSCSCIPHWSTCNKLSFNFSVCVFVYVCVCRCSCSFVQGVSVSVFLLPERSSLYCADIASRKDRKSRLRCRIQIRISVSTQYFKLTIHLSFWACWSDSTKGHDPEIIFSIFLFSYFCLSFLPSKRFLSLLSFFLFILFASFCIILHITHLLSSLCCPFHQRSLPSCVWFISFSYLFLKLF